MMDAKIEAYFNQVKADQNEAMRQLWEILVKHRMPGFEPGLSYGMPAIVIPHSLYPAGYHCKPEEALPFVSIAAQKNFIAVYHMGIYAMPQLLSWFTEAYGQQSKQKLDMGKSCIRFKKPEHIPLELIAELMQKVSAEEWISTYESLYKPGKKKA
jgi:hypothetical protein